MDHKNSILYFEVENCVAAHAELSARGVTVGPFELGDAEGLSLASLVASSGAALVIAGFATVLMADGLFWLGVGQVPLGLAVGLLYYASLFYSMDVGEARAEQGGIHEAMMGAGNFVGPGIGALSLLIVPHFPNAGVWSVCGLLVVGLGMLVHNRLKGEA